MENRETQPGEALDSLVEDWFKPASYALILLSNQGDPCIFDGDYYGIECESIPPKRKMLRLLLEARTRCAHGRQRDYFDDPNAVGWTREGDERLPGSGLAVVLGNDGPAVKQMRVGARHAGAAFRDALGNSPETLLIEEKGEAVFHAPPAQASVWVPVENGLTGK